MLSLVDETPFEAEIFVFPDAQGVDTLYVVAKATFTIGKRLEIAAKQRPVVLADVPWGAPGKSSVKYAGEAHLSKPSTDVIVVGRAFAPHGRPVPRMDVGVRVGPVKKMIAVLGDRTWKGGLISPKISSPEPFVEMPLTWERAFGGAHEPEGGPALFEPRNPVGTGFRGKRAGYELEGMKLPNLEDPAHMIGGPDDRPPPAGVGFVAPSWEPRRSRAGTYDDRWATTQAPYLPADFDPRFFNAATPDLVCPKHLEGGEPVEILNAAPEGLLRFELPACPIEAAVDIDGVLERPRFALETVLIEPDALSLSLTYRAALPCDKLTLRIDEVRLVMKGAS